MAITNYLVHFLTEDTYTSKKSELRNDAVAFVKDATIIHTHGTDYYCGSGPVALKSELSNYATTSALTSGLAGKANVSHTHTISQISGLQEELDSKLESVSLADLGVTATAAELNYMDGVTSNVQTQLNEKVTSNHTHTTSQISGLATVAVSGSYNDLKDKPSIPSLSGYATQSWVQSQGYLTSVSWSDVGGKPSTFTPSAHTHEFEDINFDNAGNSTQYLGGDGRFYTIRYSELSGTPDLSNYLTNADLSDYVTSSDLSNYVTNTELSDAIDGITVSSIGAAAASHTHNASDINEGVLNIARIPTGTSASTVALGNHTHSEYALETEIPDISNLATKSELEGYLPLTGGTLMGNLTMDTNSSIDFGSVSISASEDGLFIDNNVTLDGGSLNGISSIYGTTSLIIGGNNDPMGHGELTLKGGQSEVTLDQSGFKFNND